MSRFSLSGLIAGKLLLALAVLLVALLVGLYAALPGLARYSIEYWLTEAGYSDIEFELERPGYNQFVIDRIKLSKRTPEQDLQLEAGPIQIDFTPQTLLNSKRFDRVLLPQSKLRIRYLKSADELANQTAPEQMNLALAAVLPSVWLAQIPSDELLIGELSIKLTYDDDRYDWTFVGAISTTPEQLISRVKFFRKGQDLGWADLELRSDNYFELRMLYQDSPFVVIEGQLERGEEMVLSANQDIDLAGLSGWLTRFLALDTQFVDVTGNLTSRGEIRLPLRIYQSPDEVLALLSSTQEFKTFVKLSEPTPQVGNANGELRGDLQLGPEGLQLTLKERSFIDIKNIIITGSYVDNLRLKLRSSLAVNSDLTAVMSGKLQRIKPFAVELSASPFSYRTSDKDPPLEFDLKPVTFRVDSADLGQHRYTGSVKLPHVKVKVPGRSLPALSVTSDVVIRYPLTNLEFSVSADDVPLSLGGTARYNLTDASASAHWTMRSLDLTGLEARLARYLPELPPELTFSRGSLYHNGQLEKQSTGVRIRGWNAILDADFAWQQTQVIGLNWQSATSLNRAGQLNDSGEVRVDRISSGVLADNLTTRYRLSQQTGGNWQLRVEPVRADLLAGKAEIGGFTTRLPEPEIKTDVILEALDLDAVLSLERQEGLSGKGQLSGQFPLRYGAEGLSINDGSLYGLEPGGEIRFQPSAGIAQYAATNAGLSLALNALENFQYDTLDIKLNYTPDGTALLNTRLKGHNPDWNQGHPVDFTINIEENIPDLIKTLQFADQLTEKLEKRYRDQR